jgi:hypothetical protein
MMDAMFIGSMHGVADSCSLNGGFRLDVANTRLSEFSVPLLPITRVQESISKRGLANEVNGSPVSLSEVEITENRGSKWTPQT